MGSMASWAAVKGASKDAVLAHLGVVETGERVLQGGRRWSRALSCWEFPNDWLVIFSEDFDWADAERLRDLSRFGPVVGLQFEDKVELMSIASGFEAGVERWRIFHVNTPGRCRFEVSGDSPPDFARIVDEERAKIRTEEPNTHPDDYCFYEVPIDVAHSVCGYRDGDDDIHFVDLRPIGQESPLPPKFGAKILNRFFGWSVR